MRLKTVLSAFVLLIVGCDESVFDIDSKTSAVYTGPSLKLPLPSGYQWRVNTEAKSGNCGSGCTDSDHVNTYSIDFGRNIELFDGSHPPRFGDGVVDLFAAAEGDVVEVVNSGCRDYDVDDKGNCNPGAYSRTCRVIIDHGNGYKTRYLHFTNGSIAVTTTPPNNHVTQGQYLGKMGTTGCSTGTHLHFDVTHNGNRATTNPELAGLSLEGLDFIDGFKSGNYRASKNGFTYNAYPDFPHTCSDEPVGGSPCTRQTSFNIGQQVWSNLRLNDLTEDICFKIEFYKGDDKKAETGELWCSSTIKSDGGWSQAYLWGSFTPREAGTDWTARYFVRLKNGGASYLPAPEGAMAITPKFIVNNVPIPSTPTLISPISAPAFPPTNKVNASPLTLDWSSSAGANFYDVVFFIWNGTDWQRVGLWAIIGDYVNVSGVPTNTYCAWFAQACNDAGCSAWSDVGYFQTLP